MLVLESLLTKTPATSLTLNLLIRVPTNERVKNKYILFVTVKNIITDDVNVQENLEIDNPCNFILQTSEYAGPIAVEYILKIYY